MNRVDSFRQALKLTELAFYNDPKFLSLECVIYSLKLLINIEEGKSNDYNKIKDLNFGWLVARELDGFYDEKLMDLLYDIADEVDNMLKEKGISND